MAQNDTEPAEQSRYWLITSPRTASNMLVTILNLDGQGVRPAWRGGYFFMPIAVKRMLAHVRPMTDWSEEERATMNTEHQECFGRLQDYISAAQEEGQRVFVKEHAILMTHPFFESEFILGNENVSGEPLLLAQRGVDRPTRSIHNLTWLPDEFLKTWKPTFLIRHPAMMFPSLFRTCRKEVETEDFQRPSKEPLQLETTIKWIRAMYDFYRAHFGENSSWPVVLDADDIMKQPELVVKYAQLIEFDKDKLKFSWGQPSEEVLKTMSEMHKVMFNTIHTTSKVDLSKVAGDINISKEAVKWKEEFGEEGGIKLERWVRGAMPDYEVMYSRRLTLE